MSREWYKLHLRDDAALKDIIGILNMLTISVAPDVFDEAPFELKRNFEKEDR